MAMDKTQPKSAAPSQPKSKPAPALSGSARPFLLRKRNSTQVLRCPDLSTLRQWIAEKRLTRDDEVSRSGQKWRKMGTIVEFESLFYSVDQERIARRKAQGVESSAPAASVPKEQPPISAEKAAAQPAGAAKTEAAAEKPVIGTLKVTPPGLNQVSGNLSLMRLARPGSGKGKPAAPTPPGLSSSAAAAKRAQDGKGAEVSPASEKAVASAAQPARVEASKAAPVKPTAGKPDSTKVDSTKSNGPADVFKRGPGDDLDDNDATRRMERDSKTTDKQKPTDPVEDAIKRSDPVPRALQEARDVTQKIAASEPDEYEMIERQAARRRNGILLLVAGGAALGLYYLLGSDQPTSPTTPTNPPGIEQKGPEVGPTASAGNTAPKPIVEPLPTSPNAVAPNPTLVTPPPIAKPVALPTPNAPVGPAPAPTVAAKPPAPTVTPLPTATPLTPTASPTATAAAKPNPPVVTPAPAVAVKPPVPTVAPTATAAAKPAVPTPAPTAAVPASGAKITSDEVRKIIEQDIPKTFDGQIELANKFFERGKYDQALAVYQLMLTYAPNVPAIHKALGDIAFERNQADQALAHYNQSIQIRPSYSAAEFGLGKTYHRLKNDKDQAIAHYQKYLELNPKGSAAAMCRDGIVKLGGTVPAPAPAAAPTPAPAIVP